MRHPMRAIKELDCVVLNTDLPGNRIAVGDVGTVVHVYGDAEAFEVELADQDGMTIALVTLARTQIELALNR